MHKFITNMLGLTDSVNVYIEIFVYKNIFMIEEEYGKCEANVLGPIMYFFRTYIGFILSCAKSFILAIGNLALRAISPYQ